MFKVWKQENPELCEQLRRKMIIQVVQDAKQQSSKAGFFYKCVKKEIY